MLAVMKRRMAKKTGRTDSAASKREALRQFRQHFDLSLENLADQSDLSRSMLSKFELGQRDISPEAWTRVIATIQKLRAEDEARRKQEREKAGQIAARLGVIDEAKRKTDVEATTGAVFTEVWDGLSPWLVLPNSIPVSQAEAKEMEKESLRLLGESVRKIIEKHVTPVVTQRNFWQEAFHSQSGVISELKARLAKKPGRGRTNKTGG